MRTGSDELDAALLRGERTYDVQVRMGGRDVTSEVSSWSVSRGSDTSMPDQVAVATGSSSAEADITLSGGHGLTPAQRYSPWAPRATADVTRPGQSCVVSWGLAEQRMQSLRGRVRSVQAAAESGEVEVAALDGAELLRGKAWLPPGADPGATSRSAPSIHTQWAVDHALRMAGVNTAPPPRKGAAFFASMNGSLEANIGVCHSRSGGPGFYPERSPWTAGPATVTGATWNGTYSPQTRILSQFRDVVVEWWTHRPSFGESSLSETRLVFADRPSSESGRTSETISMIHDTQARQLRVQVGSNVITWNGPTTWNQMGRFKVVFHLSLPGVGIGIQARAWLYQPNGELYESTTQTVGSLPWSVLERVVVRSSGVMECVGVTPVEGSFTVIEPWTRGASVDLIPPEGVVRGLMNYGLRALPETRGTWWDMLKDIASTTMAYMNFDEDGFFHFRPASYVLPDWPDTEADLEVTSTREISELSVTEEIDTVANHVTMGVSDYRVSALPEEKFYDAEAVWGVQSGFTVSAELDLTSRPWATSAPMTFAGSSVPNSASDPSVVKFLSSTGTRAAVEVTLEYTSGEPLLHFYNRGAGTAWSRVAPATGSDSSLQLAYHSLTDGSPPPGTYIVSDSVSRYGTQALDIAASDWVQTSSWARILASYVARWTAWPTPSVSQLSILPDPRIQQGDIVRIVDPEGVRMSVLCRVLGYSVEGSGSDVRMTLDVRAMETPERPQDAGLSPEPILDPRVSEQFPG